MRDAAAVVAHVTAALDRRDGARPELRLEPAAQRPQLRARLVRKLVERRHVPLRDEQEVRDGAHVRERVARDEPVLALELDRLAVVGLEVLEAEDEDAGRIQTLHLRPLSIDARGLEVVEHAQRRRPNERNEQEYKQKTK